jgi:hypothetical protein
MIYRSVGLKEIEDVILDSDTQMSSHDIPGSHMCITYLLTYLLG